MAYELTVPEAAKQFGVSVQTMRAWVAEGAPVIRTGRRGGPGSILDGARLPVWVLKRSYSAETVGDHLQNLDRPCGGNFMRWLVEIHSRGVVRSLGVGWRQWYDASGWKELGLELTDEQARTLTWKAFGLSALFASVYTLDVFDDELERDTDANLDAWASILFKSDFDTDWSDNDTFSAPAEIAELVPEKTLAELQNTTVVKLRKKRRGKKKRTIPGGDG